ncbi:hypothetical protein F511_13174 [Dorcoceras hygrometricum]|uniref:Uncharacterized protein n=1 Tax=Dorcoceras hygrometricum TaxID=472368 RepID=A0A2Z7BIZ7_9LAMI|nr:hypothetical protein F511_13174 [Dorcoceras hygrometricum]
MRSVVASHGHGSNPRGNAICNAILLQSFPVLQIFGLQYLDRHLHRLRIPKYLKFQNRSKPGPASRVGPKTSRAARDRPEPNPRRIQTSRHDIAGAAAGDGGAATTKNRGGSARTIARSSAPQRRISARQCPSWRNNLRHARAAIFSSIVQPSSTTSGATSQQRPANVHPPSSQARGKLRTTAQSSRNQRRPNCRPACGQRAQRRARSIGRLRRNTVRRSRRGVGASPGCCAFIARGPHALAREAPPRKIAVDYRQSGPRPDPRLLRQAALEALTRSARTNTPRKTRPEQFPAKLVGGGGGALGGGGGGL